MRLAQVNWVCNSSCENPLSPSCAKMNLWKLPFTVENDFKGLAWVCVVTFILVPAVFVGFRTWTIWTDGAPALKTSMSSEWGNLPEFLLCDKQGSPAIFSCTLHGFKQEKLEKGGGSKPAIKWKNEECTSRRMVEGRVKNETFEIATHKMPENFRGHCLYVNMSSLQPTLSNKQGDDSEVILKVHVLGTKSDQLTMWAVDPDPTQPWSLLAFLNAGTSMMELEKKEAGYQGFGGKKMSSWKNWLDLWSPKFKSNFDIQLEAYNPDKDIEHVSPALRKKMEGWEKEVEKKIRAQDISEKEKTFKIGKLHEKVKKLQTYQNYGLVMSIKTQHVVKELEIGRVPQTLTLLSKIGGWMSVITCLLGIVWVQKHPNDDVVKTYNTRTFIGSEDPSETQFTRSAKAGQEWAHLNVQSDAMHRFWHHSCIVQPGPSQSSHIC